MHNVILFANQNKKLFTENQCQKQKWAQRCSYIIKKGVLTGNEAQNLIEIDKSSHMVAVKKVSSRVQQWALSKCSLCSLFAHNAHTCPEHQSNVWWLFSYNKICDDWNMCHFLWWYRGGARTKGYGALRGRSR